MYRKLGPGSRRPLLCPSLPPRPFPTTSLFWLLLFTSLQFDLWSPQDNILGSWWLGSMGLQHRHEIAGEIRAKHVLRAPAQPTLTDRKGPGGQTSCQHWHPFRTTLRDLQTQNNKIKHIFKLHYVRFVFSLILLFSGQMLSNKQKS